MNDEKLKYQLGANIVRYRKHHGMTQAGLAEKLNYSDKAVSKWERGESMPDVITLVQIAEQFDITVNDLLADPNELPENNNPVQRVMEKAVARTLKRKADKRIILALSSVLVWFVALFAFVIMATAGVYEGWLAFTYAGPINCIVMLSLLSAWKDFRANQLLISGIMWGSLLAIYLSVLIILSANIWMAFLLGIPGQIAIFLWFKMFRKPAKEELDG